MPQQSTSVKSVAQWLWVPVALCGLLFLVYLLANFVLTVEYVPIAMNVFVTVILVLGLQLFSGNSGILSFGHVAFMAIGAYVSALLTIPVAIKKATFTEMPGFLHWVLDAHFGTVSSTLIAGGCAAVFALVVAAPIVRLKGVAAGIATLALLVIVHTFDVQTTAITRGTSTMIGVPSTTTLGSSLIWAFVAIFIAFAYQASRRGIQLRATRENEPAARSVGISVPIERGVAWVVSAFLMGMGGALYAHYVIAFGADEFYLSITFTLVLMLVAGGLTSVSGAVIGAVFISVVKEILRRFENGPLGGNLPGFAELVLAVILLAVLIARPSGLTAGRELSWPGAWRRIGKSDPGASDREAQGRAAASA
jgi:branched-chain amino acid transport system permease protein